MELKGKISVTSTSIVHGIKKRQSAPSKWSVHHGGNEEACMGFPCSSGGSRRLRKHGCGTDGPGHIPNRQEEPTGWLGPPIGVKGEAYSEANEFCAKEGKAVETLKLEQTNSGFARAAAVSLEFRCVPKSP